LLPAEIDLATADGALVAGVRAELRLVEQARDGALVVPSEALLSEGTDTVVYVTGSDIAHRRVVRVGTDNGVVAEVLDGVSESDVVLVGGRGLLREGTRVEVAR
jgi:multidrug efflux pump subunit AcrA (membrane-fusion protein)